MATDNPPVFGGAFRPSADSALEESGFIGTHRRWTNISRYEIIFLVLAVLATILTDGLSIYRMSKVPDTDSDFAYGTLIIISSLFLLIFLITGIFQQRITDIVAFFISDLLLTIYVIVHYIDRRNDHDDDTEAKLRLVRLIVNVVFNLVFLPLSIVVIRDYQRDEFSKRLFGAFPAARKPLKFYNIFDCIARINTMLSVSVCFLNLYNFNQFEIYDKILLGIGVPLAFLWLGFGVGMIHLENRILMVVFYLISLFQPGFIIYCLVSAIEYPPTTTTTMMSTTTTTTITTTTVPSYSLLSSFYAMLTTAREIPIFPVLCVCIGLNLLFYILSIVLSLICVRNFGKGLKEKVFTSRLDKYFQKRLCAS